MPVLIFSTLIAGAYLFYKSKQQTLPPGPVDTTPANFSSPTATVTTSKPTAVAAKKVGGIHLTDSQGLFGRVDMQDFVRGNNVAGYSGAQILAIARGQAPRYGVRFVPHNIADDGQIHVDANGRRFIRVKFIDPRYKNNRGTSTENVYLAPKKVVKKTTKKVLKK